MQRLMVENLGRGLAYGPVWEYQEKLLQANLERKRNGQPTENRLLLLEHNPVYTLGKSGKPEHVLISEAERAEKAIEYFHINRGGDITFHGPGQLVGYPILDLENFKTDLGWYLRTLEEVFIQVMMEEYGLKAGRSKGETGVWLDADLPGRERKICAMGIRCSRWITMHGFAFNVNTNLDFFGHIVPCGIVGKDVTSLERELGEKQDIDRFSTLVVKKFCELFGCEISTTVGLHEGSSPQ
jgi:lipoyl(octanoyl) transferase